MRLSKSIAIIFTLFLMACNNSPLFDREVWLDNPGANDHSNPRGRMVDDVVKTHLKPGMSKTAVLHLLGKPYYEGIEKRLPKNTVIPDSIAYADGDAANKERSNKKMKDLNNFYELYAKPVMVFKYPVGWATIDPNYLLIIFDEKDIVRDYWVAQG